MKNGNGFKFEKKSLMIIGAIAVVVIAAIVAILLIVNGSKDITPEHVHSWSEWKIVTEPTCISDGVQKKTCACGETEMQNISALGHTEVVDQAKAPTCTDTGLTEGKHCSVCNEVLVAQQTVPATGHIYDNDQDSSCNVCGYIRNVSCAHTNTATLSAVNATCTQTGLTEGKKCADCGEILVAQQTIPTTGHTEVTDAAKTPTCTVNGLTEGKHCSVCGGVIVAQQTVPAAGHVYDDKYDETCNVCGHTRDAECAHANTTTLPAIYATCTETGLTEGKQCSKCGEIIVSQQTISAIGHTEVIDKAKDPTCTETGLTEGKHCSVCNEVIIPQQMIPATGHIFEDDVCKICGQTNISQGLAYVINADGVTCYISGIGTCTDLDIIIPEYIDGYKVTSIGDSAFYDCDKITSVVIPTSVSNIEALAFRNCNSLANITIPNSITSIGDYAFVYCSSLTSVDIPNSVTNLGIGVFSQCSGLISVVIGNSVTSIRESTFSDCISLTSVDIPNSVTSIGYYAFLRCSSLTSIVIPDSVTVIDQHTFTYCSSLMSVVIPDNVTFIGPYAFYNCGKLTSITIPDSVTGVSSNAFDNTGYFNDPSNWDNEVLYIGNHLIVAKQSLAGSYTIRDGTKSIVSFYNCSNLTGIVIPDSVTRIGAYAFYDCSSLTSVVIPNSVTYIGEGALGGTRIESATIPAMAISHIYLNYLQHLVITGGTSIDHRALTSARNLTSVVIGNSVMSIGNSAFAWCERLTSIVIPDSVTSIGDWAFQDCSRLTSISFKGTIEQWNAIPKGSYWNKNTGNYIIYCADGTIAKDGTITYYKVESQGLAYEVNGNGTCTITGIGTCTDLDIVIPEYIDGYKVTSIGESAFKNSSSIISITIPNSVTRIGDYAFYGCGFTTMDIPYGVTSIGYYAFQYCSNLTSITLPNTLTTIHGLAFGDCGNLTSIVVPNSVTSNLESTFSGCHNLISVVIGNGVTSIGESAFEDCTNLISIVIGDKVTNIGPSAFRGCSSLTNIEIPDSIKSINGNAFEDCSNLVYYEYGNAYYLGNSRNLYLILIKAKNEFITTCEVNPNTKIIYHAAFKRCKNLAGIVIFDGVTSIGGSAFGYCTNLTSITIPDSVTSIGDSAFYSCSSLTSITFAGTIAQWNEISKGLWWNGGGIGNYTIYCTDGNIKK